MAINPEKEEYELQHYNFSSEELVAQNVQMVQSLLNKSLSVFTDQLILKQQIPEASAERLRASCTKTAIAMYNDCQPAMNKLNELYRQTFSIPENVLLPTDLLQARGYTEELVSTLTQEVQSAKDAVMQGAVFLESLEAEMEVHRALVPSYDAEEEVVEMLKHFQEEEIDPDDVSDLVKRLEIAGVIADSSGPGATRLRNFINTSTPMKQAALAGNARSMTGVTPLYSANGPSCRISSRNTSRIPFGYVPSGAVCSRDFSTSAGIPIAQFAMPAIPPAKIVPSNPIEASCFFSPAFGARARWMYSYVRKYMPEAGTSRNNVANAPL
uniref:Uncharacterized protein n=1 Tax=Anopheles dirus TaxID=7168 RepID=A0A182NLQ3_9DIPT